MTIRDEPRVSRILEFKTNGAETRARLARVAVLVGANVLVNVALHRSMTAFVALSAVSVLAIAIFTWSTAMFRLTLTATGADIRGFRRRRISWAQVTGVTTEVRARTRVVWIWLEDGERITLPVPRCTSSAGLDQFDKNYHAIGQWWVDHRGHQANPVASQ